MPSRSWCRASINLWRCCVVGAREISLEDQLISWQASRPQDPDQQAYDLAAIRVIVLGETEPALRTAWLMACDQAERELIEIIANRLQRSADDVEVRLHAAAATSVIRVIEEYGSAAVLSGADPVLLDNLFERMARAVRVATGWGSR